MNFNYETTIIYNAAVYYYINSEGKNLPTITNGDNRSFCDDEMRRKKGNPKNEQRHIHIYYIPTTHK